jgi:putative transposase
MEIAKATEFVQLLHHVKKQNAGFRAIVLFWDNLTSHKAANVLKTARKLNIHLVNLPKYAPDLNPIEFIWKSVHQKISEDQLIQSKTQLQQFIQKYFYHFA